MQTLVTGMSGSPEAFLICHKGIHGKACLFCRTGKKSFRCSALSAVFAPLPFVPINSAAPGGSTHPRLLSSVFSTPADLGFGGLHVQMRRVKQKQNAVSPQSCSVGHCDQLVRTDSLSQGGTLASTYILWG